VKPWEFCERKDRPEAIRTLIAAIERAAARIAHAPAGGLPAPRPYPKLARPGRASVKEGTHWIADTVTSTPPAIVGVFHDRADLLRRA
jgi:plasmid stabilization system protein ParE